MRFALLVAVLTPGLFGQGRLSEAARSVSRGSLRNWLMPVQDLPLSSRAAGVIEKFGAEEGQMVQAGDLLVQLSAEVERAEVAHAEAVLESTDAELARAQRELERATTLRSESIGSQKDFEDAQYEHVLAIARRKQALSNLEVARARLSERAILAPIDGLLFKRSRAVGEAVERLETVLRLVDASSLEFTVYAGADLLGKFAVGQTANIMIDAGPARGTLHLATISFIDPIMDPESGTFRIKMRVTPTRWVQPGIPATLQLPSETN